MGRVREFINFLNEKKAPGAEEKESLYSHISFEDKIMSIRRKYRAMINKEKK